MMLSVDMESKDGQSVVMIDNLGSCTMHEPQLGKCEAPKKWKSERRHDIYCRPPVMTFDSSLYPDRDMLIWLLHVPCAFDLS